MWAMTISLKRPITRLIKTDAIMISEAMPTFLVKDLVMDVQYQKVAEKAKDYELYVSALTRVRNFFMIGQSNLDEPVAVQQ